MDNFEADATAIPPDARVLAAVSSGADSMALLFWLHTLGRDFVVGHINHDLHELRHGDCDRDEDFVRAKCQEIGAPFRALTVVLPRRDGHVNELVAREARYAALAQIARENNCQCVATAHTADDGLETALLNLMRGAAPGGWLGIAPRRVLSGEIELVRPLWRTPRAATRQILRKNGWNWREDASNTDVLFRRNRVRHEVLPLLADISGQNAGQIAQSHAKNAQIGRDEAALLDKLAHQALESLLLKRECAPRENGAFSTTPPISPEKVLDINAPPATDLLVLDGLGFRALDVAMQRRVLRLGARVILPELRDLEARKIEAAREAIVADQKRAVWTWRKALRVEWTGAGAGNRVRFWRVKIGN